MPAANMEHRTARGTHRLGSSAPSILAVGDDALILTNTAAMLEHLGHQVTVAYSGREALDTWANMRSVDLVITTQAMPGMTCIALASQIRREYLALLILLATGYTELPSSGGTNIPRPDRPFLQAHLDQAITNITQTRAV